MNILQSVILKSPLLAVLIVFWAGFIASLSSCTLVRIPIVLGFVSGSSHTKKKSFLLSLCLVLGLIVSYTFLGIALILLKDLSAGLVHASRLLYTFFGVVLLGVGIFYAGLVKARNAHATCDISSRFKKRSFVGAFLFGVMFAFLEMPACPCCASVLFVIVSIVGLVASRAYSFLIFFSFAVGQSVPILLIGSSTTLVKHLAPKVERMEKAIQFAAGIILMMVALFFLILA